MNQEIIKTISQELNVGVHQIEAVLSLLEEGNTVPFIARYRKEKTGALDEDQIRTIDKYYQYQVNLLKRKEDVIRLIEEKGISIEYPIFEGKEYNFCEGVIKVIAPTEKEVLNVAEKIEKRNKIQEHASDSFLGNIDEAVDEYKSDTSETNRASIIICVEFENKNCYFQEIVHLKIYYEP